MSDDDDFQIEDEVFGGKGKHRKLREGHKTGIWTQDEQIEYLRFVQTYPHWFDKAATRSFRIFKQMSQAIPTRTAEQCRSHHNKMRRHNYVQNIMGVGIITNLIKTVKVEIKQEGAMQVKVQQIQEPQPADPTEENKKKGKKRMRRQASEVKVQMS